MKFLNKKESMKKIKTGWKMQKLIKNYIENIEKEKI